jgi:hypothetical protein
VKVDGQFLKGRMALYWTGAPHDTPGMVGDTRDYDGIAAAGRTARDAVWAQSVEGLAAAVRQSYAVQRAEGMNTLPGDPASTVNLAGVAPLAWKYCGGGFGGYALYLCKTPGDRDRLCALPGFRPIEPFTRDPV